MNTSLLHHLVALIRGNGPEQITALSILEQQGRLADGSLAGMDFSGMEMPGLFQVGVMNVPDANFSGVQLEEMYAEEGSNFDGVNFTAANLNNSFLTGSQEVYSRASGAIFDRASLVRVQLPNILDHASFRNANLGGAAFWGVCGTVKSAIFIQADLSYAWFGQSDLRDSDFTEAILSHTRLFGANLSFARMLHAKIEDVECDEETILPDGTHWTPDTDWGRFTDPNHPNYWEPKRNE